MSTAPRTVTAADIAANYKPPEYPRVRLEEDCLIVDVMDHVTYEANNTQAAFIGLIHHLSQKNWCDRRFINYLIQRTAKATGWRIHPFQIA